MNEIIYKFSKCPYPTARHTPTVRVDSGIIFVPLAEYASTITELTVAVKFFYSSSNVVSSCCLHTEFLLNHGRTAGGGQVVHL